MSWSSARSPGQFREIENKRGLPSDHAAGARKFDERIYCYYLFGAISIAHNARGFFGAPSSSGINSRAIVQFRNPWSDREDK